MTIFTHNTFFFFFNEIAKYKKKNCTFFDIDRFYGLFLFEAWMCACVYAKTGFSSEKREETKDPKKTLVDLTQARNMCKIIFN